jgi:hypothetical protein
MKGIFNLLGCSGFKLVTFKPFRDFVEIGLDKRVAGPNRVCLLLNC